MSSQATKELNRLNFIRNFYREKFSKMRSHAASLKAINKENFVEYIDAEGDRVTYEEELERRAKMNERLKRYDEVMAAIALIDEDLSRYV